MFLRAPAGLQKAKICIYIFRINCFRYLDGDFCFFFRPHQFVTGLNCSKTLKLWSKGRQIKLNNNNTSIITRHLKYFYKIETFSLNFRFKDPIKSYSTKMLNKIYKDHEKEKKDLYEERVLQSEKGSFVPLVFTTSGGMGPRYALYL